MLCVQLCFKCFGRPARTAMIDKPLLALVLAKLGFVPAITDRSVPVFVGRSDSGSDSAEKRSAVLVAAADARTDLKHRLPKSLLHSQRITVVDPAQCTSGEWRKVHLLSTFSHPDGEELRRSLDSLAGSTELFSARLVAFFGTIGAACSLLFAPIQARGLLGEDCRRSAACVTVYAT